MHGALLEYSSPYRTVFTSYGMFSMPLRRWRRGRENGLVAIQAQRRNARPPPPRFSSTRGGQVIEDEERCAAASWLRFLRIQQMHSYQVPSAHTPTDRPRKTGPLAVVPASAAHCHGSQWNLDSGSLPCNISVPRRVQYLFAESCSSRSLCNPGSSRSSRAAACTSPPLAPLHDFRLLD